MNKYSFATIFYLSLNLFLQIDTNCMQGEARLAKDLDNKIDTIEIIDLPIELQLLVIENLVYISENCKEALKNLHACFLVNRNFAFCVKNVLLKLFRREPKVINFIKKKDSFCFVLSNNNLFKTLKKNYLNFLNSEKRIEEVFNSDANNKSIEFLKQLIVGQINDFDKLSSNLIKIYINFLTLIIKNNFDRKLKVILANKFFDIIYHAIDFFRESFDDKYIFFDNHLYNCFDSEINKENKNSNTTTLVSLHIILELFKLNHEVIFTSISKDSHLIEVLCNFFFSRHNYQELRRPPPLVMRTPEKELEDFMNFCLSIDRDEDKKIFLEFLENKKEQFINWLCTYEQPNEILSKCLLDDCFNVAKLLLKYNNISQTDKNQIFCRAINEKCSLENSNLIVILKLLVDFGIDINYKDVNGDTFLMKSINKKDLCAIEYLLKNQARIDSQDNEGKTPLIRALEQDSPDKLNIIKLLFEYDGKKTLDITDKSGQSARQIAKKYPIIEKLI